MVSAPAFVLLLVFSTHFVTCDISLAARKGCDQNYVTCSPKGASLQKEPLIGSALSPFYVDIVNAVDGPQSQKRAVQGGREGLQDRASGGSLCCADGTQCLLLRNFLSLPFCYDNYTTNYFLPGGSYGQIVSGNFTLGGSVANLISGTYILENGTSGNIYGSPSPSTPDVATLVIPTQYTASGSGSAIPVTALGREITYTTTILGTTVPPRILSAATTSPIVSAGSTVSTLITTEPTSTISGTTVTPQISTVTTKLAGAAATKKGSATIVKPSASIIFALLGFLAQILDYQEAR